MVRPLTSALALLVAGSALGQAFGRFGYTPLPSVPGFLFSAEGFRSSSAGAYTLKFSSPLAGFKATEINDRAALYVGPEVAGLPSRIRVNLRSPGFSLYFPHGLKLHSDSLQNPNLSWKDGSAGSGVPTPPSTWALVSFQDRQPPLLLVFEGKPMEVITEGKAGAWTVSTRGAVGGWVRVCLPLGHYGHLGASAANLGEQVKAVLASLDVWTAPTPSLVDFELRPEGDSLLAVWTFDRPGAVIPPAALMARVGGYPLQILSGVKTTGADLWEGPTTVTAEPKLVIRFPMARIPMGRSLALGAVPTDLISSASPFDVPSLTELAVTGLMAGRDQIVLGALETVTEMYALQTPTTVEVHTQRKLPFSPNGSGIDLAAAHALIEQARAASTGLMRENLLFAHVAWKRDWYSWLVWAEDQKVARRASAILSLAAVLSHEPEKRLEGAMLQAGLAAERALVIYRERRKFPNERTELIEPMFNLRAALYQGAPHPFVTSLLSEVRIVSAQAVSAEATPEGLLIRFKAETVAPGELVFEVGRPVTATIGTNLKSLVAKQALGRLTVEYQPEAPGVCTLLLKSPGWTNPLPLMASPPRYQEY